MVHSSNRPKWSFLISIYLFCNFIKVVMYTWKNLNFLIEINMQQVYLLVNYLLNSLGSRIHFACSHIGHEFRGWTISWKGNRFVRIQFRRDSNCPNGYRWTRMGYPYFSLESPNFASLHFIWSLEKKAFHFRPFAWRRLHLLERKTYFSNICALRYYTIYRHVNRFG